MSHAKLITDNLQPRHMKRLISIDKTDSVASESNCPLVQLPCMLLDLPVRAFHLILGTTLPTYKDYAQLP